MFFSLKLKPASEGVNDVENIYIGICLSGNLFKLKQIRANVKTTLQLVKVFADDVAHSELALQKVIFCFENSHPPLAFVPSESS